MGWRDIQAGVNDGSVSFVQKPEEESLTQGINRALGNYLEINKGKIAAKAKAKADKAAADLLSEKANKKAMSMATLALQGFGHDKNSPAFAQTLQYAINNPDQDNVISFVEKLALKPQKQTVTTTKPVTTTTPVSVEPVDTDLNPAVVPEADDLQSTETKKEVTLEKPVTKVDTNIGKTNAITMMESSNRLDALWNDYGKSQNIDFKASTSTLAEVLEFTDVNGDYAEWSKTQTDAGLVHTPVGKYQFLGTTLKDIVDRADLEAMGITEDTIFTAEVQDKLFNWYANDTVKLAGDGASINEIREKFRGRWEVLRQTEADEITPKVSDQELDAIIKSVMEGTYLDGAEVGPEVTAETDNLLEDVVVAEVGGVQFKKNDPYLAMSATELQLRLGDTETPEEDKARIRAMLAAIPGNDPLKDNPPLAALNQMKVDTKYSEDTVLLARIDARINSLGNEPVDYAGMQPDILRQRLAVLTAKASPTDNDKAAIANINSALGPDNIRISDAELAAKVAEEFKNSDKKFMSGLTTLALVAGKSLDLDTMEANLRMGDINAPENSEKKVIIDRRRELLLKQKIRLEELAAEQRKADIAKAQAMKVDEGAALNQTTRRIIFSYDTLTGKRIGQGSVFWDGTEWYDEAFKKVDQKVIDAGEIYLPEDVDQVVKIYNDEITKYSRYSSDAVNMTVSILELKQTVKDRPELLNRYIQSIGGLADQTMSLADAWASTMAKLGTGPTDGGNLVDTDGKSENFYTTWEKSVLGNLGTLNKNQQLLASQFLRVAYQIAKIRGSTGQGLSNAELDGILKSLGQGLTQEPDFSRLMDKTLASELGFAERTHKTNQESMLAPRAGNRKVLDILEGTPLGRTIEESYMSMTNSAQQAQYMAFKNGMPAEQPTFDVPNQLGRQPTKLMYDSIQGDESKISQFKAAFGIEAYNYFKGLN